MLDYRIGVTAVEAVTSTPGTFTQVNPKTKVITYSTVDCHIAMRGTAGQGDFFLKGGTYFIFSLIGSETLSYVLDSGASDGTIYLTQAD